MFKSPTIWCTFEFYEDPIPAIGPF